MVPNGGWARRPLKFSWIVTSQGLLVNFCWFGSAFGRWFPPADLWIREHYGTAPVIITYTARGPCHLVWRRRAGSNRCIAVLQTAPLATWVRRPVRNGIIVPQ